ncbi:hypothetical protein POM88_004434 [Heracleum sosnowskyi]|uniref:VQ domain-containing protein n=1 Tax=Heracleum sosnowskyi TaxID=360622 RepID=A0AAD8JID4_9APIA|nr:hypothetical protein POM88_004434 [Heracleum sosnowskyi]
MGKRLGKRKARISKRNSRDSGTCTSHEKKNLNHLVKVLKPRVYIIDPSNFKSLVQELTGNGITNPPLPCTPTPISSSSSISSVISQPTDDQQVQLMQNKIIVDQDYCYNLQESSPEWSFERSCSEIINVPLATIDTWYGSEELNMPTQIFSNEIINQAPSSFLNSHENISEGLNMSTQVFSNDMIDQADSSLLGSHDQMNFPQFGDEVEYSWISEMNNPLVYNHDDACGAPIMPQEGCDYAYDISWIM